jgi:hypothetical protein
MFSPRTVEKIISDVGDELAWSFQGCAEPIEKRDPPIGLLKCEDIGEGAGA